MNGTLKPASLRSRLDEEIAKERISGLPHSDLDAEVVGTDSYVEGLLYEMIRRLPVLKRLSKRLKIEVRDEECPIASTWHGYSEENRIVLFHPALASVTSLFFALVHEYAHVMKKAGQTVSDDNEETWADSLAWYCVHPNFLKKVRPQEYSYWEKQIGR